MTINAFKCKKCGMIVESKSRHDFQACKCGNFIDGGHDYIRMGGNLEDMEDIGNIEESPKDFSPEHLKRMGVSISKGGEE